MSFGNQYDPPDEQRDRCSAEYRRQRREEAARAWPALNMALALEHYHVAAMKRPERVEDMLGPCPTHDETVLALYDTASSTEAAAAVQRINAGGMMADVVTCFEEVCHPKLKELRRQDR